MGDHGQIEIKTNGYTDTMHSFCGFDECRERILTLGLGIEGNVFTDDEFDLSDDENEVIVTVRDDLGESDSCEWCIGCGDFLRHANASLDSTRAVFFGCECPDPEKNREAMRPLVVEDGRLELRPY